MLRHSLKGQAPTPYLLMACAAFNFRKFIRSLCFLCLKFFGHIFDPKFRPSGLGL